METQARKVLIEIDASYLGKLQEAGFGRERHTAFNNAMATAMFAKGLADKNRLFLKDDSAPETRPLQFKFI